MAMIGVYKNEALENPRYAVFELSEHSTEPVLVKTPRNNNFFINFRDLSDTLNMYHNAKIISYEIKPPGFHGLAKMHSLNNDEFIELNPLSKEEVSELNKEYGTSINSLEHILEETIEK